MKTIDVTILDVKVSAPLLNPKAAAVYENGMKKCIERIRTADERIENGVEALKEQCNAVIDYIDEVFGVGTSRQILGEETDVLTCLDALTDMANLYEKQVSPVIKAKTEKLAELLVRDGDKGDPV